ncbi:MAG: hypothetical protein RLZZ488_1213 [Pseudomonadota bacterium]|jgi:hypothetical protein
MSQSRILLRSVILAVAASISLGGCGTANSNRLDVQEDESILPRQDEEVGSLGIVGGTNMNSTSPLIKYMRAVRQRFQMNGNSGNLTNGGDRFCSGVAVGANTIVTASHCVELLNNAGEYIMTAFHPNTTLPYDTGLRRVFYGHMSASHHLPLFPAYGNYTANPNYGAVNTSANISHSTSIRSADVGFLYDWNAPSPSVIPLCTEVPAVGQQITVTGIKLTYKTNPVGYYLGWGEYKAKITQVINRPTTLLSMTSSKPAVWNFSSPTFSQTTVSTAMEFVSEALDPVKDCTEGGDSGGGVFLTRANGSQCLLGVNSARGATVNLGTKIQCTPTMHRRVVAQMLASLPDTKQLGTGFSFLANVNDGPRRSGEFNTRMANFPAGLFVPLP